MKDKILAFLKKAFSEANGSASATRVLAGTVVMATLSWVTYIVLRTHALPDLSGASLFVGSGFSGYGMNKIANAVETKTCDEVPKPKVDADK
jgi:hypothetical protein